MTGVKISALPSASAASTFDQLEVNQAGTTRRITVGQVAAHISPTGPDLLRLHGAVGDGVTDDTVAFQATVNAMANNILYVFPGTYLINGTIALPSNITIVGTGGSSILKTSFNGPILRYEGSGPGIGATEIHLRNLKMVGSAEDKNLQNGTSFLGVSNASVIDCSFEGLARGVSFVYSHTNSVASKNIQITGNRFYNIGDTAIFLKTAVENCVVSGNTIDHCGFAGPSPNFFVGITVDDASGSQLPIASTKVVVANNTISNIECNDEGVAIVVSGCEDVIVANNTIMNIGTFTLQGARGISLRSGSGTPFLRPKRVLVTGNTMTNIASHAIRLYDADQCAVTNNLITGWGINVAAGVTQSAVYLESATTGCDGCVVSGNTFIAAAGSNYGVTIAGILNENNLVHGNVIIDNGFLTAELNDIATNTIKVTNASGQVSTSLPGIPLLMHGATGSGSLSTTASEFLVCQGIRDPNALEQGARVAFVDTDIRVRRWRVALASPPGAGNSRTFTLRRAGVDTAVTATIADTANSATFTGDVLLTAGNYLTIRTTLTGTPVTSAVNFVMRYSI